jgi:hypothetical protein
MCGGRATVPICWPVLPVGILKPRRPAQRSFRRDLRPACAGERQRHTPVRRVLNRRPNRGPLGTTRYACDRTTRRWPPAVCGRLNASELPAALPVPAELCGTRRGWPRCGSPRCRRRRPRFRRGHLSGPAVGPYGHHLLAGPGVVPAAGPLGRGPVHTRHELRDRPARAIAESDMPARRAPGASGRQRPEAACSPGALRCGPP